MASKGDGEAVARLSKFTTSGGPSVNFALRTGGVGARFGATVAWALCFADACLSLRALFFSRLCSCTACCAAVRCRLGDLLPLASPFGLGGGVRPPRLAGEAATPSP